jgi:hypothetical protein
VIRGNPSCSGEHLDMALQMLCGSFPLRIILTYFSTFDKYSSFYWIQFGFFGKDKHNFCLCFDKNYLYRKIAWSQAYTIWKKTNILKACIWKLHESEDGGIVMFSSFVTFRKANEGHLVDIWWEEQAQNPQFEKSKPQEPKSYLGFKYK